MEWRLLIHNNISVNVRMYEMRVACSFDISLQSNKAMLFDSLHYRINIIVSAFLYHVYEFLFLICTFLFSLLVRIHTISSHRLKPHLLNNSLPVSKFSLPTHKNRKEGVSAIISIGRDAIYSKVHDAKCSGYC